MKGLKQISEGASILLEWIECIILLYSGSKLYRLEKKEIMPGEGISPKYLDRRWKLTN